jgi:DNA-binding NarL/FixJ family response regulator
MQPLKILLVDDHRLTIKGVRRALEEWPDIEVVGEAHAGGDVLPLVRSRQPDLVLLDLRLPGLDGFACLDLIRKHHPDVKVVIFSASAEPEEVEAALRQGAHAYVLKNVDPLDFPVVLRQAVEQTVYFPLPAPERTAQAEECADLTDREKTILTAVMRGLSNKEISREFWVTEQTVKFHLSNIYRKLGVPNRTAAVRVAHEHGLGEASNVAGVPAA